MICRIKMDLLILYHNHLYKSLQMVVIKGWKQQKEFVMTSSQQETAPIIVRMIEKDRQYINRMIQHKRAEFESVIRKGVVSMLNAQDEKLQLAAQRSQYLSFLSIGNQNKKKQLYAATHAVKENTNSAPMGIGSAVGLAATGVNAIGSTILDNAELRRQQAEAQDQLFSAQIQHYISSKDYTTIAKQVAGILSYRFQLLLFRLAPGEHGYIKLAHFFVRSMKTYAIERLREHKSEEVIKAFVDAAIPPSTDALSYRKWPNVDISNFKIHLKTGVRKTLQLDEDANQILERCGPAVRTLLGAYQGRVDAITRKLIYYNEYTIIGALNHAPILNHDASVTIGLETKHRKQESIDGSMKYPMILLGRNETTADLGANFATKPMGQFLEDAHVVALYRLVPNFFSYEVNYTLQIRHYDVEPIYLNNADVLYANERLECPWTANRERRGQQRLQKIYSATSTSVEESEEVVERQDHFKLKAMEIESNVFDVTEANNDALKATDDVLQALLEIHSADTSDQFQKRFKAALASKYAAMASCGLMVCIEKFNFFDQANFKLAIDTIVSAKTALHAIRAWPVQEADSFKKLMLSLKTASKCVHEAYKLQCFHQDNIQLVVDFLKNLEDSVLAKVFVTKEKTTQSKMIRVLRSQIKEDITASSNLQELAKAIAEYGSSSEEVISSEDALAHFNQAAQSVREALDKIEPNDDSLTILETIKLCHIYIQKNAHAIQESLKIEDYWISDHVSWAESEDLTLLTQLQRKEAALAAIRDVQQTMTTLLRNAEEKINTMSLFSSYVYTGPQIRIDLIAAKDSALEVKNKSIAILSSLRIAKDDARDIHESVDAYLERATAAYELSILRFLVNQKKAISSEAQSLLHEKLVQLQDKFIELTYVFQKSKAKGAKSAHEELSIMASTLSDKMSCQEIDELARKISLAFDDVEHAVMDDVELETLSIRKTQQAMSKVAFVIQDIRDIEDKLSCLEDDCLIEVNPLGSVNASSEILLQLEKLSAFFDPKRASSVVSSEGLNVRGQLIKSVLSKFITNFTTHTPQGNLNEDMIRGILFTKINETKGELFQNTGLVYYWDIYLIAAIAKSIAQTAREELPFLSAVKKSHHSAQQSIPKELFALKEVVNDAMISIKKACQLTYDVRIGHSQNLKWAQSYGVKEWSLTSSTLFWAGRLSVAEHKWSQKQVEQKRIQRQVELAAIHKHGVVSRSFGRMFYLMMLAYCNDKLVDKKRMARDIYKLNAVLKLCLKKIYDLQSDLDLTVHEQPRGDGHKMKTCKRLIQWVDIKREQVKSEKKELEMLRTSITEQCLRIYFNDLKQRLYDPNTQPERLKIFGASQLERQRIAQHETLGVKKEGGEQKVDFISNEESTFKNAIIQITIEDLRLKIEKLQTELDIPITLESLSSPKLSNHLSSKRLSPESSSAALDEGAFLQFADSTSFNPSGS